MVLPRTRRTRSQYWAGEYLRHRDRAFQQCRVSRSEMSDSSTRSDRTGVLMKLRMVVDAGYVYFLWRLVSVRLGVRQ
jgi:hypothetical protein